MPETAAVKLEEFAGKVCDAKCCTMTVVDGSMPGCLRCSQKGLVVCFESEMEFCVPLALEGVDKRGFDERHVCLFQRGELTCVKPPILSGGPLCKGITQCLCLEQRFALPCDDEVPCTVACCFVQCFREFKWEPKVMAEAPTVRISIGGGPQSEEMSR